MGNSSSWLFSLPSSLSLLIVERCRLQITTTGVVVVVDDDDDDENKAIWTASTAMCKSQDVLPDCGGPTSNTDDNGSAVSLLLLLSSW